MWRQMEVPDKVRKGTQQCVLPLSRQSKCMVRYVYNIFLKIFE